MTGSHEVRGSIPLGSTINPTGSTHSQANDFPFVICHNFSFLICHRLPVSPLLLWYEVNGKWKMENEKWKIKLIRNMDFSQATEISSSLGPGKKQTC